MTRKFSPENLNFLGTCFSLVSLSEQFSKNFYSVNSSLLLKQQRFILFAKAHQAEASHRTHVKSDKSVSFRTQNARDLSQTHRPRGSKETEVFRISCFRHLEKPIKTKEHKIKHLFLYVFIGFVLFF